MSDKAWRMALAEGEASMRFMRRVFRIVPSNPRCGMCLAPFRGPGGCIFRMVGFGVSRKNPNWCRMCFEEMPIGGAEAEIGVLFADVRGYTTMAEKMAPEDIARLMNRFYTVATSVLAAHEAVIDKLIGDEVMALFIRGFAGEEFLPKMASSAEALLRSVGYGSAAGPWLALGVGVDYGRAFVGNVGSGDVKDFTALGDVVNTAARLQSEARPGQIMMSERVYEALPGRYADAARVELTLKGKSEPVAARVIEIASVAVQA